MVAPGILARLSLKSLPPSPGTQQDCSSRRSAATYGRPPWRASPLQPGSAPSALLILSRICPSESLAVVKIRLASGSVDPQISS